MTIKSILKTAGLFLGKDDVIEALDLEDISQADQKTQKEIEFLIKCLNLAYQEVATDYIPLINKEILKITDGKIYFSNLEKNLIDTISLKDENGFKIRYKNFPTYLQTSENNVQITYRYSPAELTSLSSEVENFSNKISEKVLAFGLLMEYCFILGLYEDAEIWEKRFKDALIVRSRKKSSLVLPSRRWI